ncbi:MAG: helix-turn-helix domain-containing protein [Archaeoglobaceae archaeon]
MEVERMIAELVLSEEFGKKLEALIKNELKMEVREFAKEAGISESTIYKIISGKRDPNLRTLRQIAKFIADRAKKGEDFVAVIVSRAVLNMLVDRFVEVDGRRIPIREYPANGFEEAIVSAVRAEKDGAKAIVCAPILSPTVEKIVRVPIVTIIPKEDLLNAIKLAGKKVASQ